MGCFYALIAIGTIIIIFIICGIGVGLSIVLGLIATFISSKGNKLKNGLGAGLSGIAFTMVFIICYIHNLDEPLNHDLYCGDSWFCRLDKSYSLSYIDVPPFSIEGKQGLIRIPNVDSLAQKDSIVYGVHNKTHYFYLNTESDKYIKDAKTFNDLKLPTDCKQSQIQSAQYFYDNYKGPYRELKFDTWPEYTYSIYAALAFWCIFYFFYNTIFRNDRFKKNNTNIFLNK